MAKDPICGMTVDEATALQSERAGQSYYFCSEHCREKFHAESAPARTDGDCRDYKGEHDHVGQHEDPHSPKEHTCCSDKKNPETRSHAHHSHSHHDRRAANLKPSPSAKYYCPMCSGVESDKPGDCAKCGMALERNPAWVAPKSDKPIYTCPMHSEVQQDHPGNCPQCGMTLEQKTVASTSSEEENTELTDMTRRFWIGGALALPVFLLAMAHLIPALRHENLVMGDVSRWIQYVR